MSVEQLEEFPEHVEITPYLCTWEQFPTINVITSGITNFTMGSMKRKFKELLSINQLVLSNLQLGGRPPLAFYDIEFPGGALNSAIPDDMLSLCNFYVNFITFWSSQGNLSSKKSKKIEENAKFQNVSRFVKNVTRFHKT